MTDNNSPTSTGTTDDSKIIIGLDFGTTYSGAVWAHSQTPKELIEIKDWPGSRSGDHCNSEKVQSQIRYLDNGEFEWGAQVANDADPREVHKLFKLLLAEENLFENATAALGGVPLPTNVDQTITDYMTGIFECVLRSIRGRLGPDMADRLPAHIVLTVPAIWSDLAKQRTMQAFSRVPKMAEATISLLSEPEAAAISALRELDRGSIRDGDTFVVVDAGGGTVDLITYTVDSLFPMLKVNEATVGTGDLCGAAFVNLRFQQFLTAKLQNEPEWDTDVLHEALKSFETRAFSLSALAENRTYSINVGGLTQNIEAGVLRNGRYFLNSSDVHMFYERYILRIVQLIKEQIVMCDNPIQTILLVGGFGQSMYLRERVERAISEDKSIQAPMEVLQPPNGWLAVARGAVMKGIAEVMPEDYDIPVVMSRAARKHYGYEVGVRFDSNVHSSLISQKYWNAVFGAWHVRAMAWFIKRGERVSEDVPFTKSYFYHWPVGTQRRQNYPLAIYADEISSKAPIARSGNVRMMCRLTADLSPIPENELDQRLGADGRMHYEVEFEVEAIWKRYDTVTAE
ncbi:hypothetical protein FHL15_006651 [Xylaria flabelliformis]|uniref:Uncharacterized protein n=1 Tax=Xylaria flabelliformis TaxID=2512241 RepID=A0A553HX03_9PEZI|nr:hypothetical protein FHL15_006651 [Xylaria flabelliformis]